MLTQKTEREEQEREREREHARVREKDLWPFGSSFLCFFLPLGLTYVNWASRSAVCPT